MTDRLMATMTIHYAQTLDGRIATTTGHSQWISCEESLRLAHQLRASHDAVMVGVGTILNDDPRLTVRHVTGRSPCRIVVDSLLRLPLAAQVLTDGAAPTIVATTQSAHEDRIETIRSRGARVLFISPDASGRVDLDQLLRRLDALEIGSVLLEGGRRLITAALRQRLAERLVVCIAPKVIGAGIEAVGDLQVRHMDEALTFTKAQFTTLGEDIIFDGQLQREPALRG
jgi:riboflavin-specific deaminase-like protein